MIRNRKIIFVFENPKKPYESSLLLIRLITWRFSCRSIRQFYYERRTSFDVLMTMLFPTRRFSSFLSRLFLLFAFCSACLFLIYGLKKHWNTSAADVLPFEAHRLSKAHQHAHDHDHSIHQVFNIRISRRKISLKFDLESIYRCPRISRTSINVRKASFTSTE